MKINDFLQKLRHQPESVTFQDTVSVIDENYRFTPSRFRNGDIINEPGQNSGSCKLFSFAKLHALNEQETLNCFGDFYRIDVMQHPDASDHQNIRNFMRSGWAGVEFDIEALAPLVKD